MNLRELRYFIEVVKNNGFGRATETLHVTQPAISRAIKQLEDELGGELLIRESRGVRLTERGRILLRYAENILQQENNLHIEMNDTSEEITGVLKVGLPPIIGAVYFPEILFTFRKRCPKVELEIVEMPTPQ
ncbi:MAG: LysR family transcriptional regulator, partial [Plesiomonas shigelloides]